MTDLLSVMPGLTRQTIVSIERGHDARSLDAAFRIARVFQAGLADVFQYKE